ncbi:uncharacterized protein LOC144105199 [Amblyomma americanum]
MRITELASEERVQRRSQEEEEELAEVKQRLASAEKQASQLSRVREENRALEKQVSRLERELEQLSSQLDRSRLETDRQNSARLRDKNAQVAQLLADLQDADADRQSLQSQVTELAAKLADAARQMDDASDQLTLAQEELDSLRQELWATREERASMTRQIESLQERLSNAQAELGVLSDSCQKETAALREEMVRKEEELDSYRDRLAELSAGTDRSTIGLLREALEERDRQLSQLSQSLEQATRDLEDQSAIIEALQLERRGDDEPAAKRGAGRWLELQRRLREKSLLLRSVQQMLDKVEEETRQKDKQLADAVATARKYELGEYGLSDAVAEIRDLRKQLAIRDREIEKLTSQLNEIEMEVQEDGSPLRATRRQLEERVAMLERENRRQRLRLAAHKSSRRWTPQVPMSLSDRSAQTSPHQETAQVEVCEPASKGDASGKSSSVADAESSPSPHKRRPSIIHRGSSPMRESSEDVYEACQGNAASLFRLYEETIRAANAWKAGVLRLTSARDADGEGQAVTAEEELLVRAQLYRRASLERLKDAIILEQLGRFEALQETCALRVQCLQRRLDESVSREAYLQLCDAYSVLVAGQVARLAEGGSVVGTALDQALLRVK